MLAALDKAFVVSLEIAPSAVTARANVILPVAAVTIGAEHDRAA